VTHPIDAIPDSGYAKIDGEWYVRPPGCPFAASIRDHVVIEHEDGTITVSPSILYEAPHYPRSDGSTGYSFHGFLERGVWRGA